MKHMTYSFILTIYYILFSYCTNNFHKILYRFYERVRALQDNEDNYDVSVEYNSELTMEDILFNIMINCYEDLNEIAE